MNRYENHSLLPYHTFGMDVKTSVFIEYTSVDELKQILQQENLSDKKWLHIGGGSNLLFTGDYEGVILHSAIKGTEIVHEDDESVHVRVGAGEVWDDFVAYAVNQGWYGAENLSLIPGEVGASAVQNIGAYGMEAKDLIVKVEALDVTTGNDSVFTNTECRYAYRESIFKKEWKGRYIITYVTYRLSKSPQFHLEYGNVKGELEKQGSELTLKNVRDVIIRIREAKLPDPKVQGNAGSFFMNPVIPRMQYESLLAKYPEMPHYKVDEEWVKVPAAWMIDRCGWKGKRMGNAGVHDKQALVLVNCGGATGQEIITLSQHIQQSVYESFGIAIVPEVNFI
jgi:UDP-N-acetylmuramate dehydrogenase